MLCLSIFGKVISDRPYNGRAVRHRNHRLNAFWRPMKLLCFLQLTKSLSPLIRVPQDAPREKKYGIMKINRRFVTKNPFREPIYYRGVCFLKLRSDF